MAIRDPMTGLFNVRHLYNVLELEIERAKRYNLSFSILIIDIDNFKGFNDRLGHLAGDELLKQYGRFLFDNSRKADTVARYGGDEFIIVLSLTGKENAAHLSKRIMNKLKKHKFSVDSEEISLMVTIGEASFPQDGRTSEKLIRKADRALLEGKKEKHIKNQKDEN
jgi:diguanylate cyclase (GGDEF)-like protein